MLFLLRYYNDEIIIYTEILIDIDEKLFELFCITNHLAKYFAECHYLFKYFVLQIMITG